MSEAPKGEQSGTGYYNYPVKCMACSLHYTVHSWYPDWHERVQADGSDGRSGSAGGYCPECGTHGAKMLFTEETVETGFIFEVVGHTTLLEMTPKVQDGIGHGAPTVKRMEEGA